MNMEKRFTRLKGAMAILAAGTALTIGTIHQEGIKVKTYPALAEKGYCTLMVYMNGSDLESDYGCATEDLEEMTRALQNMDCGEKIHIVVEAGGAEQWDYEPMKDISYGRFCLTEKGDPVEVNKLKTRNMGRADTLADFLNYGIGSYPAEHYGLICWNHGEGQIQGFGRDLNFEGDSLTLSEIREAFQMSVVREPLNFVAMDACLMGNIELAAVLEGKAEYLIASEDLEPQEGYDYCWIEALLSDETERDYGRQVGNAMITAYQRSFEEVDYSVTLSLMDLKGFQKFHEAFDRLLESINRGLEEKDYEENFFQQLGKQRMLLLGFNHQSEGRIPEQVDLLDFAQALGDIYALVGIEGSVEADKEKEQLQKAYEQLVIRSVSQGYLKLPCGLSIFLPGNKGAEMEKNITVYENIKFCDAYNLFVKKYVDYLNQEYKYIWHLPEMKDNKIILRLDEDQMEHIVNAYTAVAYEEKDGYTYFIYADGDDALDLGGYLTADAESTFWGIKGEILSLTEVFDSKEKTEYISPVLYKEASDVKWKHCLAYIEFSDKDPDGVIREIKSVDVDKMIYNLKEGDELIPLYPLYIGEDEEAEKRSDPQIYDNSYYIGQKISIENKLAGDDRLEMIEITDTENLSYGFLIRDDRMDLYCSDMVNQKTAHIAKPLNVPVLMETLEGLIKG